MKEARVMTNERIELEERRALRRSLREESIYKREKYTTEQKTLHANALKLFQMKFMKKSLRRLSSDTSMTIRPSLIYEIYQSVKEFIVPIIRDSYLFAVERNVSRVYDASSGKRLDDVDNGPPLWWWSTAMGVPTASNSTAKSVQILEIDVLAALDKYDSFLFDRLEHLLCATRNSTAALMEENSQITYESDSTLDSVHSLDSSLSEMDEYSEIEDSLSDSSE